MPGSYKNATQLSQDVEHKFSKTKSPYKKKNP